MNEDHRNRFLNFGVLFVCFFFFHENDDDALLNWQLVFALFHAMHDILLTIEKWNIKKPTNSQHLNQFFQNAMKEKHI